MNRWSLLLLLPLAACFELPDDPDDPIVVQASTYDVTIPADGLDLEGTLHLPERFDGDRVPAVLLVHGSGPNSRDAALTGQLNMQFDLTVEAFVDLAEALQDEGYAVLRHDKRTCGPFNGQCDNGYPTPEPDIAVDAFVGDAIVALTWMGAQDAIDGAGLAVVGHSQGGEFPPLLVEAGHAAMGVSLAGPWSTIAELIRFQYDSSVSLLQELGASQQEIDQQLGSLGQGATDLEALADGTFAGTTILGAPAAFWQSWLDLNADRVAATPGVADRLVAINGDYDWNVPPSELDGWSAAGVATVELPCVTHALNCVSQPDWIQISPSDIGGEVDAQVIEALLDSLADL
jgi:hypothetical protein